MLFLFSTDAAVLMMLITLIVMITKTIYFTYLKHNKNFVVFLLKIAKLIRSTYSILL